MSEKYSDLFDRIEESVQQFTSTENIENLRRSVASTVNDVRNQVRSSAQTATNQVRQKAQTAAKNYTTQNPNSYTAQTASRYAHPAQAPVQKAPSPFPDTELAVPPNKVPGRSGSLLMIIFGVIGIFFSGLSTMVGLADFLFPSEAAAGFPFASLFFLAGFAALFGVGLFRQERLRRYLTYLKTIGRRTVCSVKDLAKAVDKSERFVLRELQYFVKHKFFPHARFDGQQTSIILDEKTYQQYLDLQRRMTEEKNEAAARDAVYRRNPELKAALDRGNAVIAEIKETNDAIPDEIISAKLARLEDVTGRIFAYVEAHPQKLPDIRKLMDYYLPTTLKLVRAYRELDAQTIQGENILSMKKEISDTLDTINQAFENMFDNLFLSDAVDISSDISVLESMLHQEGLTDHDFKPEKG